MSYHSKNFVNFLSKIVQNKRVLHLGCVGTMSGNAESDFFTHRFLENNSDFVYGIDINRDGIERMKQQGFLCECVDANHYQTVDKYEIVAILSILQFVDNPDFIIKKSYEWLGDGGSVLIEVPNIFSLSNQLRNIFKFGLSKKASINGQSEFGEVSIFNSSVLCNLLKKNNFEVVFVDTFTIKPWSVKKKTRENLRNFLNNFFRFFSKGFGPSLVILANKK